LGYGGGGRIRVGRMRRDAWKTRDMSVGGNLFIVGRIYIEVDVVIADQNAELRFLPTEKHYFLYHILVILVCLIFFCSWKIPYIKASDVGGPGEH
jgi:hypothetical protein